MTSFRGVFVAVVLGSSLVLAGFLIHSRRPSPEIDQPSAALVRASGKCAECHRRETSSIVHQFELSLHAASNVNCLDCHQPAAGQEAMDHRGFQITTEVTSANCKQCHATEYEQYLRSRHAAPAWAAVAGSKDFTPEQIAHAEKYHKGAVDRPPHFLASVQDPASITSGCLQCHDIGKPNKDGSIGSCTDCHARHSTSIELARTPETCGQCHMGPDHSQIEIYHESKHGVLFHAQRAHMNLSVPPAELTTKDMSVPTCATCHMSGLDNLKVTHDTTERLSYWLFSEVSEKRPGYLQGQTNMQETCLKCHTKPRIDQFYAEAEQVVESTNGLIQEASEIMAKLREEKLLTPEPMDEPIEFLYFDLWHYFGRTAKHGAFMGGADFVQWHGFYEIANKMVELRRQADDLRAAGKTVAQAEKEADGDDTQ